MISIVMPVYNEGEKIYDNLLYAAEVFNKSFTKWEIIAVDDGSSDNSLEQIRVATQENNKIIVAGYKENQGKGYAIKSGVKIAQGDVIAFLDSDLDLHPEQISTFYDAMIREKADIVIGSKMHKDSNLDYPKIRRLMSQVYYGMIKIMMGLKVKDTQTGIKLFKADIIKPIMERLQTSGFAFDLEILARAANIKCKIIEMPVTVRFQRTNRFGKIKVKDVWYMIKDTFKIWKNIKLLNAK